jgi:Kef-type K+ transport system membrane component KefB
MEEESDGTSLTANTWKLTLLVIVEILGGCTLLVSAHHLFMTIFHLPTLECSPEQRFKLTALFILDFCVVILSIIGLSAVLGSFFEVCQA